MASDTVVIRMFSAPTTAGTHEYSVDPDGAVRDQGGKIVGTIVAGIWPDSPFSPHTLIVLPPQTGEIISDDDDGFTVGH